MAITSAICTSFKVELLKGVHNLLQQQVILLKLLYMIVMQLLVQEQLHSQLQKKLQIHLEVLTLLVEQH